MASDIWLRTILTVRKETRCRHMGYSFRLTARVLLYAPSQRQDSTYHGLCYTSRGALAGARNSSMGPAHEGSIRRPIAPCGCLYTRVRQLVMNRRIGFHQTNECFSMMQDFPSVAYHLCQRDQIGPPARYPAVFSRFLKILVEMALLGIQLSLKIVLLEKGQRRTSRNNALSSRGYVLRGCPVRFLFLVPASAPRLA